MFSEPQLDLIGCLKGLNCTVIAVTNKTKTWN